MEKTCLITGKRKKGEFLLSFCLRRLADFSCPDDRGKEKYLRRKRGGFFPSISFRFMCVNPRRVYRNGMAEQCGVVRKRGHY